MKSEDMRAMSEEQLALTLRETIKNLFHLRVASATDRLETPSELRKARNSIASDAGEYTDCYDVLSRAIAAAIDTPSSGSGSGSNSGGSARPRGSPARR